MATNPPVGDNQRRGAVRQRTKVQHPNGHWIKRDSDSGRFIDVKSDGTPFKDVWREK